MSVSSLSRTLGLNLVFGVMFLCLKGKMPVMGLGRKRELQFLLAAGGERFILGNSSTVSSQHITGMGWNAHFDLGARNLLSHPVVSTAVKGFSLRNMMSACSSLLGRADWCPKSLTSRNLSNAIASSAFDYADGRCVPVASSKFVIGNAIGVQSGSQWNFIGLSGIASSHCGSPYSTESAGDVTIDGAFQNDKPGNSESPSKRLLSLQSGSSYLPHPDKEETGGEDAHFICADKHVIGVADGVGGWANVGINAGYYARELMMHAEEATREESEGSIDPMKVLEKAYLSTKAKGSSTACIIALTSQGIHAVNLGDSGFVVIREGCIVFRSAVQQHDFNFTYQLSSDAGGDLPSASQVFNIPVESGDVIVAGTDGLFDNLYNNEISSIVVHAIRARLDPQVTAQKIAALARQRAQDEHRQTPFSSAAQDAGFRYHGGKLDDITVVVSYVSASATASDSTP